MLRLQSQALNGGFLKWGYPQIIHFNGMFHYKPTILGYPHLWKSPYGHVFHFGDSCPVHLLGGRFNTNPEHCLIIYVSITVVINVLLKSSIVPLNTALLDKSPPNTNQPPNDVNNNVPFRNPPDGRVHHGICSMSPNVPILNIRVATVVELVYYTHDLFQNLFQNPQQTPQDLSFVNI